SASGQPPSPPLHWSGSSSPEPIMPTNPSSFMSSEVHGLPAGFWRVFGNHHVATSNLLLMHQIPCKKVKKWLRYGYFNFQHLGIKIHVTEMQFLVESIEKCEYVII